MKAVFTGGGTAGHVMVNSVLIPMLREQGWNSIYIGSHKGAEGEIVRRQGIAPYYGISTGKLRRYFSWQNLWDCGRVIRGFLEALSILRREQPEVIYSGGGFVSVPVVMAGQLLGIPVIIRETDFSVGLANRIAMRRAKKLFVTFEETMYGIGDTPCEYGGLIIRPELLAQKRVNNFSFARQKPVLLAMGGSLGSPVINGALHGELEELLEECNVIHVCGKGNIREDLQGDERYRQYEYLEDMQQAYSAADVVLTRCGSNAISEGLALGKRMICVPISTQYSRGEQRGNALYAVSVGTAVLLEEEELCTDSILNSVQHLMDSPIKQGAVLTVEKLEANCMRQIRAIQDFGEQHRRDNFLKRLRHEKKIEWNKLDESELYFLKEVADDFEFCG